MVCSPHLPNLVSIAYQGIGVSEYNPSAQYTKTIYGDGGKTYDTGQKLTRGVDATERIESAYSLENNLMREKERRYEQKDVYDTQTGGAAVQPTRTGYNNPTPQVQRGWESARGEETPSMEWAIKLPGGTSNQRDGERTSRTGSYDLPVYRTITAETERRGVYDANKSNETEEAIKPTLQRKKENLALLIRTELALCAQREELTTNTDQWRVLNN